MVIFELDGVETDHCLSCGGTWLDAGELEMLAAGAGAMAGDLAAAVAAAGRGERTQRRCPRCRRRLRLIHLGGGKEPVQVGVDRCPRGHGLWFDRGEMRDVITSFTEGDTGLVARFFSNLYGEELSHRPEGE